MISNPYARIIIQYVVYKYISCIYCQLGDDISPCITYHLFFWEPGNSIDIKFGPTAPGTVGGTWPKSTWPRWATRSLGTTTSSLNTGKDINPRGRVVTMRFCRCGLWMKHVFKQVFLKGNMLSYECFGADMLIVFYLLMAAILIPVERPLSSSCHFESEMFEKHLMEGNGLKLKVFQDADDTGASSKCVKFVPFHPAKPYQKAEMFTYLEDAGIYIYMYILYTHSCMCSQHVQYTIFLTSAILGSSMSMHTPIHVGLHCVCHVFLYWHGWSGVSACVLQRVYTQYILYHRRSIIYMYISVFFLVHFGGLLTHLRIWYWKWFLLMKSLWNSSEVGTYEILLVQRQSENSAKFESGRFWGRAIYNMCIYIYIYALWHTQLWESLPKNVPPNNGDTSPQLVNWELWARWVQQIQDLGFTPATKNTR